MSSQLEARKKALMESEARRGTDYPFVEGLEAQIFKLEKPPAVKLMQTYSAGRRSATLSMVT